MQGFGSVVVVGGVGVAVLIVLAGLWFTLRDGAPLDVVDERTGRTVTTTTSRQWQGADRRGTSALVVGVSLLVGLPVMAWAVSALTATLR